MRTGVGHFMEKVKAGKEVIGAYYDGWHHLFGCGMWVKNTDSAPIRFRSCRNRGFLIDLVIDRADGVINVCEMKYTKDEFAPDEKTDADMRRKMSVFSSVTGTRKSVNAVLITPYGLFRNKYSGRFSNVITFDDLFAHCKS